MSRPGTSSNLDTVNQNLGPFKGLGLFVLRIQKTGRGKEGRGGRSRGVSQKEQETVLQPGRPVTTKKRWTLVYKSQSGEGVTRRKSGFGRWTYFF